MIITGMKVNHKVNPLGYAFPYLHFSWNVEEAEGKEADWVQLVIEKEELQADVAAEIGKANSVTTGSTADNSKADSAAAESAAAESMAACSKASDEAAESVKSGFMRVPVYDSGKVKPDASGGLDAEFKLKAKTRYIWQVRVHSDAGEEAVSDEAYFETAKMGEPWAADWLKADAAVPSVVFEKDVEIKKAIKRARLYILGYGVYEVYVDGKKAGDEYLMPGYQAYDLSREYQTLDMTEYFTNVNTAEEKIVPAVNKSKPIVASEGEKPEENELMVQKSQPTVQKSQPIVVFSEKNTEKIVPTVIISEENQAKSKPTVVFYGETEEKNELPVQKHKLRVVLGCGWYKGRFVFEGGFENIYGDCLQLIAELHLTYADGSSAVICTDHTWTAHTSAVGKNNIYDGETFDKSLEGRPVSFAVIPGEKELLADRTSMPVRAAETYEPARILHTPAGETVLDFGEMITGWVRFYNRMPEGKAVRLQYGELLQDGNFYRDNLRLALAEYNYVSDGEEKWIRPHFTYYGFRYVKLEGFADVRAEDFQGVRLMSEIFLAGSLKTGNPKVNRLVKNSFASQKCNFLSVPTDCPQRDERMGWTGDIALFADTACLNMDSTGFLSKYVELIALEQKELGGAVPVFVPRPKASSESMGLMMQLAAGGMCIWGDAGAILPWTLYAHSRDKKLLQEQYPVMKAWVDHVKGRTQENPVPHLWQNDIQLGDWLALDREGTGQDEGSSFGLTDSGYTASACYYYCLGLTKKAADALGYAGDAAWLAAEREAVLAAIQKQYINEDGTLNIIETQTGYTLLLAFGLYREGQEEKAVERLNALVERRGGHLDTGFLGTAYLCQALSAHGAHETACRIFLQEGYPGWLYEVNLGAVTTWERWNSLDENGKVNPEGMNSMNHYAYGSILAWMYRYLCGFGDGEEDKTVEIRPLICPKLGSMKGTYRAPWGIYESGWKMVSETEAEYKITVPFGGKARVILPGRKPEVLTAGTYKR